MHVSLLALSLGAQCHSLSYHFVQGVTPPHRSMQGVTPRPDHSVRLSLPSLTLGEGTTLCPITWCKSHLSPHDSEQVSLTAHVACCMCHPRPITRCRVSPLPPAFSLGREVSQRLKCPEVEMTRGLSDQGSHWPEIEQARGQIGQKSKWPEDKRGRIPIG